MTTLKVEKTPNYISEYADTTFCFTLGKDVNCIINFMKFAPQLQVEEGSLLINREVAVIPEVFATISLHRDHAKMLAQTILDAIADTGN
ncbi:hypothetical protein [Citrobacter freundii]|uniref:hypothetical protein n=1 Tax=Citrobacter freundii TaxID=546 RepID=UPI0015937B08|nr:hypothetical protein [Citrobacter freundii]MCY3449686.1 hypothetical protein [Citrobacter freundii]QKX81565.1 hypothetical protein GTH18_09990 [Citrobacter freundii]